MAFPNDSTNSDLTEEFETSMEKSSSRRKGGCAGSIEGNKEVLCQSVATAGTTPLASGLFWFLLCPLPLIDKGGTLELQADLISPLCIDSTILKQLEDVPDVKKEIAQEAMFVNACLEQRRAQRSIRY